MLRFNYHLIKENSELTSIIKDQKKEIDRLNEKISFLFKEICRRDQKIIEQQKRMRFFGIEIGNEEYEPEKLDFPSTTKL